MDLHVPTLELETFLLVLVRIAGFVAVAPLFAHKSVNARLRVLIAACISLTVYSAMDIKIIEYDTVLGYSMLIIKELVVGLSIGFVANLVMAVINLAGEFIDREIGFSMVTNFDASSGTNITITAQLYDSMVYVIILVNNLHYYIIKAIVQSFELVPLGSADINYAGMYNSVIDFMLQYFSIGFRISMPIFLSATILNVILGVLAKSSPQMNMFSVGMQLKVLSGLVVLSMAIIFIPNIGNFLIEKMQSMIGALMGGL